MSSLERHVERSRKQRDFILARAKREEELAIRSPTGTRARIRLYVVIGYGFIVGLIGLLLVLFVGLLALVHYTGTLNLALLKLAVFIVPAISVLIRSLWIKIPPPKGVELRPDESPELFREVKALSDRTGAPYPERILIVPKVNAAAAQVPRFGLFGPYRAYSRSRKQAA